MNTFSRAPISIYTVSMLAIFNTHLLQATTISVTTAQEFDTLTMNSTKPTLVKFYARWCGACNAIAQPFEELAQEQEFASVQFISVDIDKLPSITERHGIVGIPTFIYMEQGATKDQSVGVSNITTFKEDMRSKLHSIFSIPNNGTAHHIIPKTEETQSLQSLTEREQQTPQSSESTGLLTLLIEKIKTFIQMIINAISSLFR